VSTANALIALWLTSGSDSPVDQLISAYDTCLEIAIRARFQFNLSKLRKRFRMLVLRQLAADYKRLPKSWLDSVISRIQEAESKTSREVVEPAELLRIARKALPELMVTSPPGTRQPPDAS
jgi:hypothetical protein